MQERTLTAGPIRTSLLRFSIPIILSMLTTQLYSVIDSMIVGLRVDADALAAVANASTVLMVFLFISGGMELGASLLIASKAPVVSKEELSNTSFNLMLLDLVLALIMTVIGLVGLKGMLALINTPKEILPDALAYGRIYLIGLPFLMVYDLTRQILIATGNSKVPMYLVLITSVTNILLALIMVGPLGVKGTALATVISQITGCAAILIYARKPLLPKQLSKNMLRFSCIKEIARLAPPNMLQQMSGTIVSMVKQGLLGGVGIMAIAGFSCAGKISSFLLMPLYGFTQALVVFIAQNQALHQEDRIKTGIRESYGILLIYTLLVAASCIILHNPMLSLFLKEKDAIHYGAIILMYEPVSYFFRTARFIQEAKLRGYQRMLLYLISNCGTILIDIAMAILLVSSYGYNGFYLATLISAPIGLVLSIVMVRIAEGRMERPVNSNL